MRQQLIQYVDLLFAGAKNCDDVKQEILQNTLDRYDDLIAEGKVPEAAYRLAITGIGDINEILGMSGHTSPSAAPVPEVQESDTLKKKRMRAIAIGIYIVAAIPLILLDSVGLDIWGLCITLLLVAAATILLIVNASPEKTDDEKENTPLSPRQELKESIGKLIFAVGLVVYLVLSFKTQSWYITWLVFPIMGALKGLVSAVLDLMEVIKHEN